MVTTVRGYQEVLDDPQAALNGPFVKMPYHDTTVTVVRPPFDYDGQPLPVRRPSPEVGAHTEEILCELGYSPERIDALAAATSTPAG